MPVGESALQLLEMIAERHAKISIGGGVVQHLQFSEQPGLQIRRNLLGSDIFDKEVTQPSIPERVDHATSTYTDPMYHSTGHNVSPLVGADKNDNVTSAIPAAMRRFTPSNLE